MAKKLVCFRSSFIFLLVPVLLGIFISACAGPPEALMTASVTTGQAPLSAIFTNKSKNADEYRWDFGNGATTTVSAKETQATHEYTKAGTYTVTLTAIKKEVPPKTSATTITITVKPGQLDRVKIEPDAVTLEVTKELKFTGTGLDRFDNAIPGLSYTFRSDEKAGKLDNEGKFTAGPKLGSYENSVIVEVAQGSATKTATARVTVKPGPLDRVIIEPGEATVEVSGEQKFTATALDRFGNPIPGHSYTFRPDEKAGRVDIEGRFTAGLKAGQYATGLTVEVSQGPVTRTATARLTLRPGSLDRVLVSPATVTLDIDKREQFKAEAVDLYRNPIPEAKITWQVAGQVGTIDDTGLLRTGTKAGSFGQAVKATASLGRDSKEATASVTIKPDPPTVLSIPPIELAAGETQQLKAFMADRYGNSLGEVKVDLTVRDTNAGSVSRTGLFTAWRVARHFPGAVEARTAEGLIAITTVTIRPGPLEQVVIAPNHADIGINMAQQFVAGGADRFGNRIAGLAFTWSVQIGGATIDDKGLFTDGSRPGTYNNAVKATAIHGNVTRSATATVDVKPDRIAFTCNRTANQLDICVMNADGTIEKRLTNNPEIKSKPSWSPNGMRVVFESCYIGCKIVAVSDEGGSQLILSDKDDTFPRWSPDGKKIAFTSGRDGYKGEIYVMDGDGGGATRLTYNKADDLGSTWSPDGTKIAFVSDRDGNFEIYVMDASGGDQRRLTLELGHDTSPAWSPDGKEILFQSDRSGQEHIYVMNADGTNVRRLTAFVSRAPSWSPDGRKVLFHSSKDAGGTNEIYLMDRDGSNVVRITTNPFEDVNPVWAPRKRSVEVSEASVFIPSAAT
jgi:PKD repeat protein